MGSGKSKIWAEKYSELDIGERETYLYFEFTTFS